MLIKLQCSMDLIDKCDNMKDGRFDGVWNMCNSSIRTEEFHN